jgi:hypothetical protein
MRPKLQAFEVAGLRLAQKLAEYWTEPLGEVELVPDQVSFRN